MERWKRAQRRGSDSAAPALVSVNSYHPSFSSSLLDAIDRSIDKGCDVGGRRDGMAADGAARLHYAWQEDAAGEKQRDAYGRCADDQRYRRRGSGEYDQPQQHCSRVPLQRQRDRFVGNSTSSSSESSYGGFSSSEAESVVFGGLPLPRPVRTSAPPQRKPEQITHLEEIKQKVNKSSIRSRFRASKLYGELKKGSSTPVSPGARLASFLNTLFSTAGHPKKAKISAASNPVPARRGGDDSTCSSASSYSRSCLSKTPSSRGKAPSSCGSSAKRSVRFYPVSVIVDEDCRPCGQKSLSEGERPGIHRAGGPSSLLEHALPSIRIIGKEPPLLESTRFTEEPPLPSYLAAMAEAEERKRAREAARNLVNAYKEKNRRLDGFAMDVDEDDDDDDDAASYSSSDLFELKNLATVGCGGEVRYRDELPVYETTRLDANRAIARGLLV